MWPARRARPPRQAVQALYDLPDHALIDMGDFAGGMLKYLRRHPVPRVTIAGGFAKMTKLAQGLLDLHSRSGAVDLAWLAERLREAGAERRRRGAARTPTRRWKCWRLPRHRPSARRCGRAHAWQTAAKALRGATIALEIIVFDRDGAARRAACRSIRWPERRLSHRPPRGARAGSGGRNRSNRARCRGRSRPPARARPGSAPCAPDSRRRTMRGDRRRACPCITRSSGQDARQTTAAGQSAP